MATDRTRRLIKTRDASAKLSGAQRSRRRLQKEAIKLHQLIVDAKARLEEIDEEEQVHSDAIDKYAGEIAEAHAEPATPTEEVDNGSQEESS